MADKFGLKKSRNSSTTMQDVAAQKKKGLISDFDRLQQQGFGYIYPLNGGKLIIDWRMSERDRQRKLFKLRDDETGKEYVISGEAIQMILRHI